jgi:hypothetical protein
MNDNEILTNNEWNPSIEARFWELVAKKKNKFKSVRAKVCKLFYWGDKSSITDEIALSIMEKGLHDFQPKEQREFFDAMLLLVKIRQKVPHRAGQLSVTEMLESLVKANSKHPDIADMEIELTWQYLQNKNLSGAKELLKKLGKKIKPASSYYNAFLACRTALAKTENDFGVTDKLWNAEYKRRRKVENKGVFTFEELSVKTFAPEATIESLADNMVAEFAAMIPGIGMCTLDALELLEKEILSLKVEFANNSWFSSVYDVRIEDYDNYNCELIPSLGSYIGQWLVANCKAKWIIKKPLMKSEVLFNKIKINPFEKAYDFAYYKHNLWQQIRIECSIPS